MHMIVHALVVLSPPLSSFLSQSGDPQPSTSASTSSDSEVLPVTSYLCTWKAPRKRKESTQQMLEIMFEKHVLGRTKKIKFQLLEEFDPRPESCRGTVKIVCLHFWTRCVGKDCVYLSCWIRVRNFGAMKSRRIL